MGVVRKKLHRKGTRKRHLEGNGERGKDRLGNCGAASLALVGQGGKLSQVKIIRNSSQKKECKIEYPERGWGTNG